MAKRILFTFIIIFSQFSLLNAQSFDELSIENLRTEIQGSPQSKEQLEEHLRTVSYLGDLKLMQWIMKQKININAVDEQNFSALTYSIMGGNVNAVDFLLKSGVHFDYEISNSLYPIILSVLLQKKEIYHLLKKSGAETNRIFQGRHLQEMIQIMFEPQNSNPNINKTPSASQAPQRKRITPNSKRKNPVNKNKEGGFYEDNTQFYQD